MTAKIILIVLLMSSILNANIEITQNIKALYKGVKLTKVQEEYIIENQDKNIDVLKKYIKKEVEDLNTKYLDEKNIISFIFEPSGEINKIKFLKKSDNRKLDKATKNAIINGSKEFVKPSEKTEMRFILSYNIGQAQNSIKNSKEKYETTRAREPYYIPISNGTTRFEHSSTEYVRVFETSKDGFVNLSVNPSYCMERATLLTNIGQRIEIKGLYNMMINTEIAQGKYKILLKTKKTCNVNLEYP